MGCSTLAEVALTLCAMFSPLTFIHAADIHLDSPLHGLSRKDEAFSQLVRGATRTAFARVVDLAIDEGAAFVVIAGDLYDGAWKDQSTGQFAVAQLARLTRAGIRAVISFGNHDAESRVTRHLTPPEGVYMLANARCETVRFDDLGVAIHGRSYKQAATTENIAATYCPPVKGMLNVAMLHTALDGHEGHANYAPCSLAELQAAGHDYWALGHVHDHAVRSTHPHVVFAGNTQGRHVRETGPKGVVVVRAEDRAITNVEHRATDEIRWANLRVDASDARDTIEALTAIQAELRPVIAAAEGRPVAARVAVVVDATLAMRLHADPSFFETEVRGHAAGVSDTLWIERVKIEARAEANTYGLPPELRDLLDQAMTDPDCRRAIESAIAPLVGKLPTEIGDAETAPLIAFARAGNGEAIVGAARSLIEARLGGATD